MSQLSFEFEPPQGRNAPPAVADAAQPLTPEDIENRTFEVRKRGYDKTQVDRFLGEVANAYRMVVEGGVEAVQPRQESVPATPGESGRRPLLGDAAGTPTGAATTTARIAPIPMAVKPESGRWAMRTATSRPSSSRLTTRSTKKVRTLTCGLRSRNS